MMTILLIDGENFKGKMKSVFKGAKQTKPLWHVYDFRGLLTKVLNGRNIDRAIFYFARIKEDPQTREKSRQLIEEQRLLKTHLERQGYGVVLAGRVRGQMETDSSGKRVLVFREKGVDVKIGIDMMVSACDGTAQEIILGSSDSDLQPAISQVKRRGIRLVYLGFEVQPNKGLSYTTGQTILIRNSEVLEFYQKEKASNADGTASGSFS